MGQRRTESFLLRVVLHEGESTREEWSGRIQHVGTGIEDAFVSVEGLLLFLQQHLQSLDNGPTPMGSGYQPDQLQQP
jgi:hypothetical protein